MDKAVIAAISGAVGTLGTLAVNFLLKNRKQDGTDFTAVVKSQWEIIHDQRKRIDKIEIQLEELRAVERAKSDEIVNLRNQLVLFESSHSDIPLPMWMKNVDGRMLFVNKYYVDTFLEPMGRAMVDYIGKDDFEIWPTEVAEKFRANDLVVYQTGREVHTIEEIPDGKGGLWYGHVMKYPRRFNNKIIGISGIVLSMAREYGQVSCRVD